RLIRSGSHLARHLADVPVLILVCLEGDGARQGRARLSLYASVFPAVQNLLLAARGLGLGATLTTIWRAHEEEIKTLLGIPPQVEAVALIPVGYPQRPFGPNQRRAVSEVTYYERWGRQEP
ncbi:MAG TPA: nitroreductase family protein, partial [Dehalococcoidia bacterium]|nr:nitroreductase family protein [Dehalococcoidia bacterium]